MSGIASVTGYPDRPPTRCGAAISDTAAPLFAVIGILAALRRREQSGTGEWVDIAMLDTSAEPKASSTWERLEDFVREHVQRFIQALLEEEVTELLSAVYAGAQ